MNNLFSQIKIKNVVVKNRVVVPPMVCFGWADDSGLMTAQHIKHYETLAKGGAGLIIFEAHCINKTARLSSTQLGIWSDEHIEGLKKAVEACHSYGAKVLVQIHHAGLKTPVNVTAEALCPSDYKEKDKTARELTIDEIHSIQKDFYNAARRAKEAGFDGIELHGAHGYLIDQFMSSVINHREDNYGGSINSRMRFALEIVEMIMPIIDESFILGYRMGANAPTLDEGMELARALEEKGVDLLHVSAGISNGTLPQVPEDFPYNWIVYSGTKVKSKVSIPVIVVNGIRTPKQASYIVENNLSDFTAVGRAHLADPYWASKAEKNIEPFSCLECLKCQWYVDGRKCPRRINK